MRLRKHFENGKKENGKRHSSPSQRVFLRWDASSADGGGHIAGNVVFFFFVYYSAAHFSVSVVCV